jgi:N-acetylglucosamine-6-phosphate deacetylase
MTELVGIDAKSGCRVRLRHDGRLITSIERLDPESRATDPRIAPALWDLQVNGCLGISFSDPELTVEKVRAVCEVVRRDGVGAFCPTLITASSEVMLHGVRTIAAACEDDPFVRGMVLGLHLEGPAISALDGYRGAHPIEHVRDPDQAELERFQDASGGRVVLVTLAPEREGAIEFIRRATAAGVVVAIGHTAADGETLHAAAEAGATLSTHLGNGIVSPLPRHPNPIWHQAADDRLWASFIADGIHVDEDTLTVLTRAKGSDRTILVSDLSPLAGCAPGRYGGWEVRPDGRVVVAGTGYLAGAAASLAAGVVRLAGLRSGTLSLAVAAATANPARLLGRATPSLEPGQPVPCVLPA